MGRIDLKKQWDSVLLVLLDEDFEPISLHGVPRKYVKEALLLPGSKARNQRGQLAVTKFKAISKLLWSRDDL